MECEVCWAPMDKGHVCRCECGVALAKHKDLPKPRPLSRSSAPPPPTSHLGGGWRQERGSFVK